MEDLGPGMWYLLHMYPVCLKLKNVRDTRRHMSNLYDCIHSLMPCMTCKLHMTQYTLRNSIHVNSNLSLWIGMLHNEVNRRLGKKPVTYMEEYKWCQDCITCSFPEEGIHLSRQLWHGVRYVMASLLTTVRHLSTISKLEMLYELLEVCETTYPNMACRDSLKSCREEFFKHLSNPGTEAKGKYAASIIQLDSDINRLLKTGQAAEVSNITDLLLLPGKSEDAVAQSHRSPDVEIVGPLKRPLSGGSGEFKSEEDMFNRMMPLISGRPMDMSSELQAGYFDREAQMEGKILRQNMWIPSDPTKKPFYVKEVSHTRQQKSSVARTHPRIFKKPTKYRGKDKTSA